MTKEEYQVWLTKQEKRNSDPIAQRIDMLEAKAYFQYGLTETENEELDRLIKTKQQEEIT